MSSYEVEDIPRSLVPQSTTLARIAGALHSVRFATYLSASSGNERDALHLYRWNLELAAALHTSLSLTEVILRNAIDAQLRAWNSTQKRRDGGLHTADWLLDPARPLNSLIDGAVRRATSRIIEVARDRPVA